MKQINLTIEAGDGMEHDNSFVTSLTNGVQAQFTQITKNSKLIFCGKKVDIMFDSRLRIKFRNAIARKPFVVFTDGNKRKKFKISVKSNIHYQDSSGVHHLIVRRLDTKDTKEFLWLVADTNYISGLITH